MLELPAHSVRELIALVSLVEGIHQSLPVAGIQALLQAKAAEQK